MVGTAFGANGRDSVRARRAQSRTRTSLRPSSARCALGSAALVLQSRPHIDRPVHLVAVAVVSFEKLLRLVSSLPAPSWLHPSSAAPFPVAALSIPFSLPLEGVVDGGEVVGERARNVAQPRDRRLQRRPPSSSSSVHSHVRS